MISESRAASALGRSCGLGGLRLPQRQWECRSALPAAVANLSLSLPRKLLTRLQWIGPDPQLQLKLALIGHWFRSRARLPTPRAIEAHTSRELESDGVDTVPQLQPQVEAQRPRALGAAHTAATSSQQLRVRVALLRV